MWTRSSRPEVLLRKGVLKICNFIEIALQHGCSPVNLLHIFRTPFLSNTSGKSLKCVSQLTFTGHTSNLPKKHKKKKERKKPEIIALAGIVNFMDLDKTRCLIKSYITSQFKRWLLAWRFHSLKVNNCINNMHERALRFRFNCSKSSFVVNFQKNWRC